MCFFKWRVKLFADAEGQIIENWLYSTEYIKKTFSRISKQKSTILNKKHNSSVSQNQKHLLLVKINQNLLGHNQVLTGDDNEIMYF